MCVFLFLCACVYVNIHIHGYGYVMVINLCEFVCFILQDKGNGQIHNKGTMQYLAGTRIWHFRALRKSPWKACGQMICNDSVCCWPTTSNNILIVDHNSVKGG